MGERVLLRMESDVASLAHEPHRLRFDLVRAAVQPLIPMYALPPPWL